MPPSGNGISHTIDRMHSILGGVAIGWPMNEAISARPWGELFNRATLGWPQRFLHQFAKAGYGEMFGRVLLVGSLSSTDQARKEYLTAPGHSEGQGIADFAAVTATDRIRCLITHFQARKMSRTIWAKGG